MPAPPPHAPMNHLGGPILAQWALLHGTQATVGAQMVLIPGDLAVSRCFAHLAALTRGGGPGWAQWGAQ